MQKRPPSIILIVGVVAAIAIFIGLNKFLAPMPQGEHEEHEHEQAAAQSQEAKPEAPPPPAEKPKVAPKGNSKTAMTIIETEKGTIKIKLFPEDMPVTTKNFTDLVNRKFYDGLTFWRVDNWVVQGGDPKGDGTGGSEKTIKLEINKKQTWNKAGLVGMARSQDPDSASSQFYIVTQPAEWLNNQYALFGDVVEGMEVVRQLKVGDKMKTVRMATAEASKTGDAKKTPGPPPMPPTPAPRKSGK